MLWNSLVLYRTVAVDATSACLSPAHVSDQTQRFAPPPSLPVPCCDSAIVESGRVTLRASFTFFETVRIAVSLDKTADGITSRHGNNHGLGACWSSTSRQASSGPASRVHHALPHIAWRQVSILGNDRESRWPSEAEAPGQRHALTTSAMFCAHSFSHLLSNLSHQHRGPFFQGFQLRYIRPSHTARRPTNRSKIEVGSPDPRTLVQHIRIRPSALLLHTDRDHDGHSG